MKYPIKVVDLFAGPGGLGEGFSSVRDRNNKPVFKIVLSIENEPTAHKTLELRSFYRQFPDDSVPDDYYHYVRGEISRAELFGGFDVQARAAKAEAWNVTLGEESVEKVRSRVDDALETRGEPWVLIGGPPCQAYSLAGRVKLKSVRGEEFENDHRHLLYREYLRILADHSPTVFVMENVKGLLSATLDGSSTFTRIRRDLEEPGLGLESTANRSGPKYKLFPILERGQERGQLALSGLGHYDAGDFVLQLEKFGIPQNRHRVIIVGIRDDQLQEVSSSLEALNLAPIEPPTVRDAIGGLPPLRSRLSKLTDSDEAWLQVVRAARDRLALATELKIDRPKAGYGASFVPSDATVEFKPEWFLDDRLEGVLNHESRGHIVEDLKRYLFAATFARNGGRSPTLSDFPDDLLPEHRNVHQSDRPPPFNDRFRVQVYTKPSTTITSHISKDGHYYIHPDPAQCRSLTVREAARLQTFPDNYLFEGPRTAQYGQVGNAVPPLAAREIARRIHRIIR